MHHLAFPPACGSCVEGSEADMDALPVLAAASYLLGNLRVAAGLLRSEAREIDDLVISVALVVGAMLLGYLIAPTAVTMAVSGLGALAGIHFPAGSVRKQSRYTALACSAAALTVLMPRAMAFGLVLFAVLYLLGRRVTAAAVASMFGVPWGAWLIRGSDLFLIFGALVWLMLLYSDLDRVERQVRQFLGRSAGNLIFRRRIRRILAVSALAAIFVLFFLNRYVYHGFGLHPQVFRQGNPGLNYVAITFDDGPHPRWTAQILDILHDRDVRATFFVVGKHVDRYPEVLRRILDEGHEVGSHTYYHTNLLNAGEATVVRELALTEGALERAADFVPRLFRPPRGLYNSVVLEAAHGRGYTMALWSVSSTDWMGTSAARMVRLMGGSVGGGDVLLFHDSGDFFTAAGADRSNTVEALGRLIDVLHERGYRFVTVTELMVMSLLVEGDPP